MPPVRYTFTRGAERDFARAPRRMQQRIITALDRYLADQRTGDIAKLAGSGNEWRLRVGDWRCGFGTARMGARWSCCGCCRAIGPTATERSIGWSRAHRRSYRLRVSRVLAPPGA